MRSTLLRPTLALAALATLLSCGGGDGTDPGGDPVEATLVAGQALASSVAPGGTVRARYQAAPMQPYEILFSADDPSLGLYSVLSTGDTVTLVAPTAGARDTTTRRIRDASDFDGTSLRLLVRAPSGPGGRFRLTLVAQQRAPESRSHRIGIDEVIEERFDTPIDADVYEFQGTSGTDVVVLVKLLDPVPPNVSYRAFVRYASTSSDPFSNASPTTVAPLDSTIESSSAFRMNLLDSTYHLVIDRGSYVDGSTATPRYRAVIRRIDPRPEDRPAALTLGDTIASSIEVYGDYDDYTITGTPGDTVMWFAQATGATGGIVAHLPEFPVHDPSGAIAPAGRPLLSSPSFRFAIPASGTLTVRVESAAEQAYGKTRGGYRLFAWKPDTLPEGRPPAIALGGFADGVIDAPGDADVYQLALAEPAYVNLELQKPLMGTDPMLVTLRRAGTTLATVRLPDDPGDPTARGSGRMALAAGTYSIGVRKATASGTSYGDVYRVYASRIDTTPELVPATCSPSPARRRTACSCASRRRTRRARSA